MTPVDLEELAERVESGAERAVVLDAMVWDAMSKEGGRIALDVVASRDARPLWLPSYTTSLDVVVRLIEEKLPDAAWLVARQGKPDGFFVHAGVGQAQCNSITAPGVTPARALLAAALRAMKEEG